MACLAWAEPLVLLAVEADPQQWRRSGSRPEELLRLATTTVASALFAAAQRDRLTAVEALPTLRLVGAARWLAEIGEDWPAVIDDMPVLGGQGAAEYRRLIHDPARWAVAAPLARRALQDAARRSADERGACLADLLDEIARLQGQQLMTQLRALHDPGQ